MAKMQKIHRAKESEVLHFFWSGYQLSENSYRQYEYSNLEIAKWAEYYLSQKTAFHQSRWDAGRVTENPNDILLGQFTWDTRSDEKKAVMGNLLHDWVRDNALTPDRPAHPNTYILTPWVPEFPIEWTARMPFFEKQILAASKIFALCGDFWIQKTFEKTGDSIEVQVRDKVVHCNMGLAAQNFPVVKQRFNPIGERQILHMSNLAEYKGFELTCQSIAGLETLLHLATSSLKAEVGLLELSYPSGVYLVNFLGYVNNNDPEFNHWVVENCDFYIHTGNMDAQATTILENAARGLVPLVTPESGFASPHAIQLTQDPDENRKIIDWALNLPESELMQRSQRVREQIVQEHHWEGIFNRIWDGIQADLADRRI